MTQRLTHLLTGVKCRATSVAKNIVLCYVTVEVATLFTGLLPDEGAVTPAGKYLITCNPVSHNYRDNLKDHEEEGDFGFSVVVFVVWGVHLSVRCSEVHHQLGVLVEGCTAEATFLGGKSSAELTEGGKN